MKFTIFAVTIFLLTNLLSAQESSIYVNLGSLTPTKNEFKADYKNSLAFSFGLEIKLNKVDMSLEYLNSNVSPANNFLGDFKVERFSLNAKYKIYQRNKISARIGMGMGYNHFSLSEVLLSVGFSIRGSAASYASILPSFDLNYKLTSKVSVETGIDYNFILNDSVEFLRYSNSLPTKTVKYNFSYYQIKFGLKYSFKI